MNICKRRTIRTDFIETLNIERLPLRYEDNSEFVNSNSFLFYKFIFIQLLLFIRIFRVQLCSFTHASIALSAMFMEKTHFRPVAGLFDNCQSVLRQSFYLYVINYLVLKFFNTYIINLTVILDGGIYMYTRITGELFL